MKMNMENEKMSENMGIPAKLVVRDRKEMEEERARWQAAEIERQTKELLKRLDEENSKTRKLAAEQRTLVHYDEARPACARCKHCDIQAEEEERATYYCRSRRMECFSWWAREVVAWGVCDEFEEE